MNAVERSSTGAVLNLAQRTRLAAIRSELQTMAAKSTLTEADLNRTADLETQIRLIDQGPESGVREYGFVPMAQREGTVWARGNGHFNTGAPAFHRNRTADEPMAITQRYIVSGDPMAGQEMHAAAVAEFRASNDTTWNIATSADGGFAVPLGHYLAIVARRDELMLANRVGVRRIPGVGTTVNVAVDAAAGGEFVVTAEQNDAHENNYDRDQAALGTVAMTLVKRTKRLEITEEVLSDSMGLMPFIEDWVARSFAKTHNSMLVTEALASATAALTFDAATTLGATELPELSYLLAEEYADNAVWLMRRTTESIIRQKVGDAFQFSPNPAGTDRGGRDLWGSPLYTSAYMPAVGASAKSIVYGDFNFVGLREMPSFNLIRDPYSVDGMLVLKYSFRAVYKVLQSSALAMGTHPSA